MLCIRVFSCENFCQKIRRLKNFCPTKMYPFLFENLQKKSFATKKRACFPRSQNYSLKADDALNLIRTCLHLDAQKRITVQKALNHRLFGGEVFYKFQENSPWSKKIDYQETERLIGELKGCEKNTNVCTEECCENNSVKDAERKLSANGNIDIKIKFDPVVEIEKGF